VALAPLATTADLAARLGRALTTEETTRATALLPDASAMVRTHARQQITRSISTQRLRPYGVQKMVGSQLWPSWVRLPQRPVNAVSGVVDLDGVVLVDGTDFRWIGGETLLIVASGPVDVTYDHGWGDDLSVPPVSNDEIGILDAVAGIVCQIVGRALGRPADETALSQETVDGYSYTVGSAASAGPFGMLEDEENALDNLLGHRRMSTMRLG